MLTAKIRASLKIFFVFVIYPLLFIVYRSFKGFNVVNSQEFLEVAVTDLVLGTAGTRDCLAQTLKTLWLLTNSFSS